MFEMPLWVSLKWKLYEKALFITLPVDIYKCTQVRLDVKTLKHGVGCTINPFAL